MNDERITERDVLALWLARAYGTDMMTTEDGRKVTVDFAGVPAASGGPDILGARLTIGGGRVAGDVEIHLTPAGWRAHAHDRDGAYQSVVLHVALRRGARTGAALPYGGRRIPELVLESFLDGGLWPTIQKVRRLTPAFAPGALAGKLPSLERPDLAALGLARLRRRVDRHRLLLLAAEPNALHYAETLRGLGFGGNQAGFSELARRVPLDRLGREAGSIERALASAASSIPWRTHGVRPANRPERRLAGFARYLASTHLKPFEAMMAADDLEARYAPLGTSRGLEIVFTVDQPMAIAAGRDLWDFDAGHPPIGWNGRQRAAARVAGVDRVSSVREQMGLLEFHRAL